MKWSWPGLLVGVLLGLQGAPTVAQGEQRTPSEQNAKAAAVQPVGIEEILRLAKAGVSEGVIKAYIEHSPRPFAVNAADIITLKEQAVPDEVTVALVKRWAAQSQRQSENTAPVPPGIDGQNTNPRQSTLDPESYGFWWYYYAYPRALAAANRRVLSSYSGYSEVVPYPYGFYQYSPWPVRPFPSDRRFRHGR